MTKLSEITTVEKNLFNKCFKQTREFIERCKTAKYQANLKQFTLSIEEIAKEITNSDPLVIQLLLCFAVDGVIENEELERKIDALMQDEDY